MPAESVITHSHHADQQARRVTQLLCCCGGRLHIPTQPLHTYACAHACPDRVRSHACDTCLQLARRMPACLCLLMCVDSIRASAAVMCDKLRGWAGQLREMNCSSVHGVYNYMTSKQYPVIYGTTMTTVTSFQRLDLSCCFRKIYECMYSLMKWIIFTALPDNVFTTQTGEGNMFIFSTETIFI